jgi:hypothetical protein
VNQWLGTHCSYRTKQALALTDPLLRERICSIVYARCLRQPIFNVDAYLAGAIWKGSRCINEFMENGTLVCRVLCAWLSIGSQQCQARTASHQFGWIVAHVDAIGTHRLALTCRSLLGLTRPTCPRCSLEWQFHGQWYDATTTKSWTQRITSASVCINCWGHLVDRYERERWVCCHKYALWMGRWRHTCHVCRRMQMHVAPWDACWWCPPPGQVPYAVVTFFKSSHDGSSETSRDITSVSSSMQPEASDDTASDFSDDASMTASEEVQLQHGVGHV